MLLPFCDCACPTSTESPAIIWKKLKHSEHICYLQNLHSDVREELQSSHRWRLRCKRHWPPQQRVCSRRQEWHLSRQSGWGFQRVSSDQKRHHHIKYQLEVLESCGEFWRISDWTGSCHLHARGTVDLCCPYVRMPKSWALSGVATAAALQALGTTQTGAAVPSATYVQAGGLTVPTGRNQGMNLQ